MARISSGIPHSEAVQKPAPTLIKKPDQPGGRVFSTASSTIGMMQTNRATTAPRFTGNSLRKRTIQPEQTLAVVTHLAIAKAKGVIDHAISKPPGLEHYAQKTAVAFSASEKSKNRSSKQSLKGPIPLTTSIGKGKTVRARVKERVH